MISPRDIVNMVAHPPKIVEICTATVDAMFGVYEKMPKTNSFIMPSSPKSQQPSTLLYEIYVTHKITISDGDPINVITIPRTRLSVDSKNAFHSVSFTEVHLRFFILSCIFSNFGTCKPPMLSDCACGRSETIIREYNSWLISSKVMHAPQEWKWTILPSGYKRRLLVWWPRLKRGFLYDRMSFEFRGVYEPSPIRKKPIFLGDEIAVYDVLLVGNDVLIMDILYTSSRDSCCNLPFLKRQEVIADVDKDKDGLSIPYFDIDPEKLTKCTSKILVVHKNSEYRPWIKDVFICRPSRGPDVAVLRVLSTGLCQAQAIHDLPILKSVGYLKNRERPEKGEGVYICRLVGDNEWVIISRASRKDPIMLSDRCMEMPLKLCSDDYRMMFAFTTTPDPKKITMIK